MRVIIRQWGAIMQWWPYGWPYGGHMGGHMVAIWPYEKQIGNMCALHAINAVLQRSGFESEDLIVIADKLDEDERTLLD